jgi:hypothetical protein
MALLRKRRKRKRGKPDEIIYTKLRDVTKENPNGVKRQKLLKKCRKGERLILEPLHESKTDGDDVVNVRRLNGQLLGVLSYERSRQVQEYMSMKAEIETTITKITGGGLFKPYRGCNIEIKVWGVL